MNSSWIHTPVVKVKRGTPEGARVETCCPAKKCKKPAGHDNGLHDRRGIR